MGFWEERKLKKQRAEAAKGLTGQQKSVATAFGAGQLGEKPSGTELKFKLMDEQERKQLVGALIAKMNKLYTEADLVNNQTLTRLCQESIDRMQRSNLVSSPAMSNLIGQFMDKFISDAIAALQAPNGQFNAYQNLFAINTLIGDMTSSEKAAFYANPRYTENKIKLVQQQALAAIYQRQISDINSQANTLAADAKNINLTPTMLNSELKKLAAQKKKLEEHIQQCNILMESFNIILNQIEDEANVNSVGGVEGVTVDVSTAVEGRTAIQEGLSGIVEINEQGQVNDIAVGNSNLTMGSTISPQNNDAIEDENEALLAAFNS